MSWSRTNAANNTASTRPAVRRPDDLWWARVAPGTTRLLHVVPVQYRRGPSWKGSGYQPAGALMAVIVCQPKRSGRPDAWRTTGTAEPDNCPVVTEWGGRALSQQVNCPTVAAASS